MHYNEEDIALLALREDLRAADEHLRSCTACRQRVDHIRRIHAEFLHATSLPPDPRLSAGLSPGRSPLEIHLSPWRTRVEVSGAAGQNQISLLAARGGDTADEGLPQAAVFASEADGTVLRIVADEEPGAYRLFVLADDAQKQDRVLLGFVTHTGEQLLVATDERGVATYASEVPIAWADASAILYLPIAEFTVEAGLEDGAHLHAEGVTLEVTRLPDGVRLLCRHSSAPVPRRALLQYVDGCSVIGEMIAGVVGIPSSRVEALRTIRIFS